MYKLIGGKKNRSFRVLWTLEELGLDYELIEANPRSDEIRALNPSGKVPAFIDGDAVLIDSVAISQYLADKHGQLTHKAGSKARAVQDSFTHFACDEMDGVLWTAARHSFILPAEKRLPEIKDSLRWEFSNSMETLSKRLGDNEFLAGDIFTIADIVTAHCGQWAMGAKFDITPNNLQDYMTRMLARPAYLKLRAS